MFHAHYVTSQVRKNGTARCMYALYVSKEEREQLFANAPLQHNKVVIDWYDKNKREVCLRRATQAEMSSETAHDLALVKSRIGYAGQKVAGMYCTTFTSNGRSTVLDLPFLFKQREATARIVKVMGVPHLVWRLPTRDEVEAPRMRIDNREKLYNPEDNPSSDVRWIKVKSAVQPAPEAPKPDTLAENANGAYADDKGPRIGWGSPGKVGVIAKRTAGEPPKQAAQLTPIERLKTTIAHVNTLAAQIGGVHLAVKDGKLRASVVTTVDL